MISWFNFLRKTIRLTLYKITGINSISAALNPVTYLDEFFFQVVYWRSQKRVLIGKFKVMYLEKANSGSEFKPKFFGTYEAELNGVLDTFYEPSRVLVDIGSDDGYYAIGLTRLHPDQRAIAVESDPLRCERLQRNITYNQVSERAKIVCQKLEDGNQLLQLLNTVSTPVFIKCDIEGTEYQIFDRATLAVLSSSRTPMVIETHLNESLEANLIASMRECGYQPRIINRDNFKVIDTKTMDRLSALLCRLFGRRWVNEARPRFNRWIFAQIVG